MSLQRVAVIGAGAWGTALAQSAAKAGRDVLLFGRDPDLMAEIDRAHSNEAYLPGVALSADIRATSAASDLRTAQFALLVVPAQATRNCLQALGPALFAGKPLVLCAKGFEQGTLQRQSEIAAELVPDAVPLVLSGPSFAQDVAIGRPTAVTLAGDDPLLTETVAAALAGPSFRPYAAGDRVGVELAGGLKNVYALACGAVEGAGLGLSARSALLARSFAEMTRLVVAMGGTPQSLAGLAGLGDLVLSCTSAQSRNYWFGRELGQGRLLPQIMQSGAKLSEGLHTAPVAQGLAARYGVDAPVVAAVNHLLSGGQGIQDILAGLMSRPLKRED